MTTIEERPSIGERYSSATESSNLKLTDGRTDLDIIIAAGLVPDSFGLTLYRLMNEFDQVRGPVDAARRWVSAQMHLSAELAKQAASAALENDPNAIGRAGRLTEASDSVRKAAHTSLRTEFSLVLSVMRSLREAREAIGQFAYREAWRKGVSLDDDHIRILAGQVLDVFLDPLCGYCEGRGYNGGGRFEQTGPQAFCRPCRNSGQRRESLGKTDTQRLFASHLLMQMDAELSNVQRHINNALRRVDEAKRIVAEQFS